MVTGWTAVLAAVFVVLAIAHSVLGEREVITPLLKQSWRIDGIPRWAADPLLRFAWHMTSVAWLGLAATALGASGVAVGGLVALLSGVVVLVLLPGHLAWPLFLTGAFAAGMQTGYVGTAALAALAVIGIVVLAAAAVVHGYWAVGGRRGLDAVVPRSSDDAPPATPPAWLTAAVVVALLVMAAAMGARLTGVVSTPVTAIVAAGAVVLTLRVIGDGRYAGLTKRVRGTSFARNDDRLFTPLTALLAFGAVAALLV